MTDRIADIRITLKEYAMKDSTIDSGNLYYCATTLLAELAKREAKCNKIQADYDLCITDRARIFHRMQKAELELAKREARITDLRAALEAMRTGVYSKSHRWDYIDEANEALEQDNKARGGEE